MGTLISKKQVLKKIKLETKWETNEQKGCESLLIANIW